MSVDYEMNNYPSISVITTERLLLTIMVRLMMLIQQAFENEHVVCSLCSMLAFRSIRASGGKVCQVSGGAGNAQKQITKKHPQKYLDVN
jgi:hypothetical protein